METQVKAIDGCCEWCNGHRQTLPMGMCRLHEHAHDLLAACQAVLAGDTAAPRLIRLAIAKATGETRP